MFDAIAGRYDLVNGIVALGMDTGWRRRCIEALGLPPGATVLDVACGTGDLCRGLARAGYQRVGVDLSPGMLSHARTNAPLVLADALHAPFRPGCFDGVVSGFALRNVVDLGRLFAELARLTRPGGRISLLDLGAPESPLLRAGHRIWCNYGVPLVRLGPLRRRRLPLPTPQPRLPAPRRRDGGVAGTGRLRSRAARVAVRRHQPDVHRHPGGPGHAVVTVASPRPARDVPSPLPPDGPCSGPASTPPASCAPSPSRSALTCWETSSGPGAGPAHVCGRTVRHPFSAGARPSAWPCPPAARNPTTFAG